MPVWIVHPSWMNALALRAIAASTSVTGASGRTNGCDVALHEHVDLVDVDAVRVLRLDAVGARQPRVGLDDEQPVGVGAGPAQLVDRRAGVQREAQVAVGVDRRRRGRDDARCDPLGDEREATEVGRHELDVGTRREQEPLGRAHEAGAQLHPRLGEHRVQVDEERAVDDEILPVVALPQRVQERRGLARTERDPEGVPRPDQRRGLGARCRRVPGSSSGSTRRRACPSRSRCCRRPTVWKSASLPSTQIFTSRVSPGMTGLREPALDRLEPRRVAAAHRVEQRPAGEPVGAQPVEDRLREAGQRRERRVGVQRVAVAVESVEQRLVGAGRVRDDLVGRAVGRDVARAARAAVAAPAALTPDEGRHGGGPQQVAAGLAGLALEHDHRGLALVVHRGDLARSPWPCPPPGPACAA